MIRNSYIRGKIASRVDSQKCILKASSDGVEPRKAGACSCSTLYKNQRHMSRASAALTILMTTSSMPSWHVLPDTPKSSRKRLPAALDRGQRRSWVGWKYEMLWRAMFERSITLPPCESTSTSKGVGPCEVTLLKHHSAAVFC